MSLPATVLVIILAIALGVMLLLLFLPSADKAAAPDSVSFRAGGGSIVTVRKVGGGTSVTIEGIHDHWEGSDGVSLPLLPPEYTRRFEPELYEEYLSPKTSARRKYEIIERVYAMGLTLPRIEGLHEQCKKEEAAAAAEAAPEGKDPSERHPRNLTRQRKDDIDNS